MDTSTTGCVITSTRKYSFDAVRIESQDIKDALVSVQEIEDEVCRDEVLYVVRQHDEPIPRILPVDLLLSGLRVLLVVLGTSGRVAIYPPRVLSRRRNALLGAL